MSCKEAKNFYFCGLAAMPCIYYVPGELDENGSILKDDRVEVLRPYTVKATELTATSKKYSMPSSNKLVGVISSFGILSYSWAQYLHDKLNGLGVLPTTYDTYITKTTEGEEEDKRSKKEYQTCGNTYLHKVTDCSYKLPFPFHQENGNSVFDKTKVQFDKYKNDWY